MNLIFPKKAPLVTDIVLIGIMLFMMDISIAQQRNVPPQSGTAQTNGTPGIGSGQSTPNSPQRIRHRRANRIDRTPTLGLDQGFLDFNTPDFNVKLVRASQTLASLQPKQAGKFDFTPADQLDSRAANDFYHLGDLTLRLRRNGSGDWESYSTARERKPVTALPVTNDVLAAADLTPTLPPDCPVVVTRTWKLDAGKLALSFQIANRSGVPVEIGALGIPMIFNNYITGRSLADAHESCSFADPAICLDAGYIQVTRLSGQGPALLVVPEGKTPLEAYNPLSEDRTERSQTFEGFYEWMVHSRAYADGEWRNTQPWNLPTSETLAPGASTTVGIKFLLAPEIESIEQTLAANERPVAVGIPGYILPMDLNARLYLNYPQPVKSVQVEPDGAISVQRNVRTVHGWQGYTLHGQRWGRARLTFTYHDGLVQTIDYDVIKPEAQAVADLGNFLFTKQWFTDLNDPFHRAPSVMTYDRGHGRIVTQDARAWIAGLEDEGGAGSWLAAAMKEFGQPEKTEVDKFQQFVDGVLWGGIQYSNGPLKYGVRKSMFYYDTNAFPNYYNSDIPYGGWTSWSRQDAERIDRAYNYPHVVAAYWAMYRLARNYNGLVTDHSWDWYLNQACETTKFLTGRNADGDYNVGYIDMGLMEGDIFLMLLKDLKHEGWSDKAAELETAMKSRADGWSHAAFPFGSEMAWDSTGQEEVYAWCDYFGFADKAKVTLDSILGYMPLIPNWGYNGDARRYWDFYYGAAPGGRLERQISHYGSGINAIPVLTAFRQSPDDDYLLRVGYAGAMQALSNIDPDGFAAAAFHSTPTLMRWDTYSGDYGPNFFGHAVNTATYVIDHPEFGWQAFGGNVKLSGNWVKVLPLDSFRQRIYIAPLGLWLTLDAGMFDRVEINTKDHRLRLGFAAATQYAPQARLRIAQPAKLRGVGTYRPSGTFIIERDAVMVPLRSNGTTSVDLMQTD
ncbi:MAG: DUF5695 domain-containing protein [Verrucomicrobiota bacterium]